MTVQERVEQIAAQIVSRVRAGLEEVITPPSAMLAQATRGQSYSRPSAVRAWLKNVRGLALTDEEREAVSALGWEYQRTISLPLNVSGQWFRADVEAITPRQVAEAFTETISTFNAVRSVATVIGTTETDTMTLPVFDDRSNSATLLTSGGVSMSPAVMPVLTTITLGAYTLATAPVVLSTSALRDPAVDLESLIGALLAERIGRAANAYETTGTGSNQPRGIVTAAPQKHTAAANQLTYDDLVTLKAAIDPAYYPRAVWMMNMDTLSRIEKLKDNTGRPLFYNDLRQGAERTLFGFPVVVNHDMANVGAGTASVLFGDTTRYVIREVQNIRLVALQERFVEFDSVGFMAFYDFDANLQASATTNAIGKIVHASS